MFPILYTQSDVIHTLIYICKYRIVSALILLVSIVASITFAGNTQFRKNRSLIAIWFMLFEILVLIVIFESAPINIEINIEGMDAAACGLYFWLVSIGAIFFPSTINVCLSNDFRNRPFCCLKIFGCVKIVSIPKKFSNFIKNDKQHGIRYELIEHDHYQYAIATNINTTNSTNSTNGTPITTNDNNTEEMDKYWKLSNNKCILKCVKKHNRNYNFKETLFWFLLPHMVVLGRSFAFYGQPVAATVYSMMCLFVCAVFVIKFGLEYDFRIIDFFHAGVVGATFYTFAPDEIFVCSLIYFLYISRIARYMFVVHIVLSVVILVNFDIIFPIRGYANILASELTRDGRYARMLIFLLWMLMMIILSFLVLYIKLHPKSRHDKKSVFYQLNTTLIGIFSALLDYITDILVIIFWFAANLYFYALFEILFIITGQIVSALYVNDIYVNINGSNNSNNYKRESCFVRILLALGTNEYVHVTCCQFFLLFGIWKKFLPHAIYSSIFWILFLFLFLKLNKKYYDTRAWTYIFQYNIME